MKKRNLFGVILVLIMMLVISVAPAMAMTEEKYVEAERAANALHYMNLFQGTGYDADGYATFDLKRAPSRAEALTMLVRLVGKEADAKNGTWEHPFTDVPAWAEPYVGYAYENGLTTGTSATTFGSTLEVGASEYLTFVLRALGYESGKDFKWNAAWELSDKLGITKGEYNKDTKEFLRGDVAIISYTALDAKMINGTNTLFEILEKAEVFDIGGYHMWDCFVVSAYEDCADIIFVTVDFSRNIYKSFVVTDATVNGVAAKVTNFDREYMDNIYGGHAEFHYGSEIPFAGVALDYDSTAVHNATTEFHEEGDVKLPVYIYDFKITATTEYGRTCAEDFVLQVIQDGYGGYRLIEFAE